MRAAAGGSGIWAGKTGLGRGGRGGRAEFRGTKTGASQEGSGGSVETDPESMAGLFTSTTQSWAYKGKSYEGQAGNTEE